MSQDSDVQVRKPPVGAVYKQHKQGERGWCGWCGLAVTETTAVRGYLKYWHSECEIERDVIENPGLARHYVFKRDKGVCCDCGEDWSERFRLVPEFRDRHTREPRIVFACAHLRPSPPWPHGAVWVSIHCEPRDDHHHPFVELRAISLWHVDHKIPLWKVRHLPDLERLEYFKLANLVTRCDRCHAIKTKEEAAERAHYKRMGEKPNVKKKSKWGKGRKLQGRGFPPRGSRKMRNKT